MPARRTRPAARDADAPTGPSDDVPVPRWVAAVAVAGVAGIAGYVGAWAVAGWLTSGYDAVGQAISELFAVGAPARPATLLRAALLVSGGLLIAFGFALDRGLPGTGAAGPVAAGISGVMTVLVVAAPCTTGCPGFGSSTTDSLHTVVAGVGYAALVVAPLLVAGRVRRHDPVLARWSIVLGIAATLGFLTRVVGIADDLAGLQQRAFNTTADLWYVVVAVRLVGRVRRSRPGRP